MLLRGVRVLDLSRLLPGGYCTQLLLEQGAEVIKVEAPGGDPLRGMPAGERLFSALHAGKRLVTLDLRAEQGREAFHREVVRADVLVESFRPGVMERLGLGYEALVERNARLVYCAITGYGSHVRFASRAGHDLNYLARSGALSLMPHADGLPMIPGFQVADLAGGLQAAFLIAAGLNERSRTGRGMRLEISMTDLMRQWTALPRAARAAGLPGLGLTGELPCYRVYATADQAITVAALEPKFWLALCQAIGREDLASRQFDSTAVAELEAVFKTAARAEWIERFKDLDVCVEPVLDLAEAGGTTLIDF